MQVISNHAPLARHDVAIPVSYRFSRGRAARAAVRTMVITAGVLLAGHAWLLHHITHI